MVLYHSAQPLVVICSSLEPQHHPMDLGTVSLFLDLSAGTLSTSISSRFILVSLTYAYSQDFTMESFMGGGSRIFEAGSEPGVWKRKSLSGVQGKTPGRRPGGRPRS